MKSVVTLYYKSLVHQSKNLILDYPNGTSAIESYLTTLQKEEINDFQYVKHSLSVAIKINKNQTALEMIESKDINYVKIQNGEEKACYYFIISKNWKSTETIELVLSMDTLNSFRFNHDYILNDKTLTKRMHKDRFWNRVVSFHVPFDNLIVPITIASIANSLLIAEEVTFSNGTNTETLYNVSFNYITNVLLPDSLKGLWLYDLNQEQSAFINKYRKIINWKIVSIKYNSIIYSYASPVALTSISISFKQIRIIDLKSEDISAPVYKKKEDILYEQKGALTNSFVLYYKNKDNQDDSPIDCYLTSDVYLDFLTQVGDNEIDVNDITNNKIAFVSPWFNGQVTFDIDGQYYEVTQDYYMLRCLGFENSNGTLIVHIYVYQIDAGTGSTYTLISHTTINNPSNVVVATPLEELEVREVDSLNNVYHYTDPDFPFSVSNKTLTLTPLASRVLNPSSTIDKTLSENVKIINLPYCPSQITKDEDKYIIGGMWTYDGTSKFFKLTDFSASFENNVITNVEDILSVYETTLSINVSAKRNILDSKLYHSDYYRPKFVYDSFNRIFSLEQIDYYESIQNREDTNFAFTFVMSRNIVSKFLFRFNYTYKATTEDYPNVVAVARNNEEVLYNSSYLNYVRTGYNYDLKTKERSESAIGVGIGLNFAGFLASIGLSFIPGGQALGVMSAIGTGLGLVNQMVNLAKTTAQNEENIQKKLIETQRQGVSVLNADDYDLLYAYTGNKAKLCTYQVSDRMNKVLDDLFYYCGYSVNEQMIPDTSSRYWFNFVQASLVIEDNSNLNNDIEDDIKEKFEQGVTFLHYHTSFDFKQENENWELNII